MPHSLKDITWLVEFYFSELYSFFFLSFSFLFLGRIPYVNRNEDEVACAHQEIFSVYKLSFSE